MKPFQFIFELRKENEKPSFNKYTKVIKKFSTILYK